jgi:hypothetical protein
MSLYNTLFGMNPASNVLLKMAGLTMDEIPRFRDVSVDAGDIVVYTRTGGGNRECYAEDGDCSECYHTANSALAAKPNYLNDTDDDFDSTYAYFRFAPLDEYKELLGALVVIGSAVVAVCQDNQPGRLNGSVKS